MEALLKLPPNRVRRNYKGGAGIDWLRGMEKQEDGDRPEEWIASVVPARNPGMEPVEDEGYAFCHTEGRRRRLKDLIEAAPEFYLGEEHVKKRGTEVGFLLKLLDSSMRLHVQAHPTADFARKYLDSPYGKMECYYILKVREGVKPYIRLGFQRAVDRGEWRRIIETQDIPAMDACFEPIPVEEGQVWHIPGGMPHAIGEGILLLEIMEPTDLAVRCEYERDGILVPQEARFMGRDLDFCLDVFDFRTCSVEEITKRGRVEPKVIWETPDARLEQLIDRDVTSCFQVKRIQLNNGAAAGLKGGAMQIFVAAAGSAILESHGSRAVLRRGESLLAAAAAGSIRITGREEKTELCVVSPG